MTDTSTLTAITCLLKSNELEWLRNLLPRLHSADIASALSSMAAADRLRVLLLLPLRRQADVVGELNMPEQLATVRTLPPMDLVALLSMMAADKRATLFEQLSADEQAALRPNIQQAQQDDQLKLTAYHEGTAGALMTSAYAHLWAELSASQAIEVLRREVPDIAPTCPCYVVDAHNKLQGVVSWPELLLADASTRIGELVQTHGIVGHAQDSQASTAATIVAYDLGALPIVDDAGTLLGIVTAKDAMDVGDAARARNMPPLSDHAVTGNRPDISLAHSSFRQIFTTRAFWLSILTVFGIITSTFVAAQEDMLSEILILAAFIAPIIDSGGNTGSQSATLVIRAMALGETRLSWRDLWLVVRREIPVVLALGAVIGVMEVVLAYFSKGIGAEVMLIVGLSMFICMVLGGLIGALLPFAARRIGADPATLSAPLITSIMDLLGVVVFFGLAYTFMGHVLTGA